MNGRPPIATPHVWARRGRHARAKSFSTEKLYEELHKQQLHHRGVGGAHVAHSLIATHGESMHKAESDGALMVLESNDGADSDASSHSQSSALSTRSARCANAGPVSGWLRERLGRVQP